MLLNFITGIFIGEKLEWNLSLSPKQVIEVLSGKNEGTWIERVFAPGISVRAMGNRFSFSKMSIGNMPMSGNSFTHVLVGHVYENASGSKVVARFRLNLFVFIFALIWLGATYLIGFVGGFFALLQEIRNNDFHQATGLIFMFGFPIFGTFFLNFFRKMASANEKEVRLAVHECLDPYKVK